MLEFDKELERFKPMMKIDDIEAQLESETIEDIIDIFKSFKQDIGQYSMRKEG